MACYILNETVGRVSNTEIVENLFSGQNTTSDIGVAGKFRFEITIALLRTGK